jgi:uncharacterized SAM-binding protein YcdF (DUF218 family)
MAVIKFFKKTGFGILALIVLWAGGFGIFALGAVFSKAQAESETTDAIVVLTGGKDRIKEGLRLFAGGRAAHLFISGVYKDVTRGEVLSQWDGDHALPPCCITLGYEATTTAQNAQETRAWLEQHDYSSIRLVTDDYHMARSKMELAHALPGIEIFAQPVRQSDLGRFSLRYWHLLFSEYHKSLYRRVQLFFRPRPALERAE